MNANSSLPVLLTEVSDIYRHHNLCSKYAPSTNKENSFVSLIDGLVNSMARCGTEDNVSVTSVQGGLKKVSHYRESSLNRIKNRQPG